MQTIMIAFWRKRRASLCAALFCIGMALAALATSGFSPSSPAQAALPNDAAHLGVASCGGSTCHGRSQPDGAVVRQDEIMIWQEASSPGGAHSRAYAILKEPRSQQIAKRLGIGAAENAPMCLGCHSDPAAARGPLFKVSDGVGCEACHGGSVNWVAPHKTGNRVESLRNGLVNLSNPQTRAAVCLDCHFGSADGNQFVNHRIMGAGHPRIAFELDLFSTLQQHHNEDADYITVRRKGKTNGMRFWAVGQAMAVDRQLSLYQNAGLGAEGAFPEFYFFDCHSCHRRISDDQKFSPSTIDNPARPIPVGMPPFNDENMIMLSAAARVAAPALAARYDADARAFHAAIARDRPSAVAAAGKLRASATALAGVFSSTNFDRAKTFAVMDLIASEAIASRFTDYAGSVQAVMATDTLLNALVNSGQVTQGGAAGIRTDINRAYAAVRDPNGYRPMEFRRALGGAVRTIRTLR